MNERRLLDRAHAGDRAAAQMLAERFVGLAKHLANRYFYPGAEFEDIVQEAMLGLLSGIRTWDGRDVPAHHYLALCMERSILTGLKLANRRKHQVLNGASSLDQPLQTEYGLISRLEVLAGGDPDPALSLHAREDLYELIRIVKTELSPYERRALVGFLNDRRYGEIGEYKSIDNALQRARKKLAEAA